MAWDFSTDPEFQIQLDWMNTFVREEVEPLDLLWGDRVFHPLAPGLRAIVDPLKQQVRARGLWACHLGPELGLRLHDRFHLLLFQSCQNATDQAGIEVFNGADF